MLHRSEDEERRVHSTLPSVGETQLRFAPCSFSSRRLSASTGADVLNNSCERHSTLPVLASSPTVSPRLRPPSCFHCPASAPAVKIITLPSVHPAIEPARFPETFSSTRQAGFPVSTSNA